MAKMIWKPVAVWVIYRTSTDNLIKRRVVHVSLTKGYAEALCARDPELSWERFPLNENYGEEKEVL